MKLFKQSIFQAIKEKIPLTFNRKIKMRFTAIIEKDKDGIYVGQIEEVPAAISQGNTLDELKENLQDALELIFSVNRDK